MATALIAIFQQSLSFQRIILHLLTILYTLTQWIDATTQTAQRPVNVIQLAGMQEAVEGLNAISLLTISSGMRIQAKLIILAPQTCVVDFNAKMMISASMVVLMQLHASIISLIVIHLIWYKYTMRLLKPRFLFLHKIDANLFHACRLISALMVMIAIMVLAWINTISVTGQQLINLSMTLMGNGLSRHLKTGVWVPSALIASNAPLIIRKSLVATMQLAAPKIATHPTSTSSISTRLKQYWTRLKLSIGAQVLHALVMIFVRVTLVIIQVAYPLSNPNPAVMHLMPMKTSLRQIKQQLLCLQRIVVSRSNALLVHLAILENAIMALVFPQISLFLHAMQLLSIKSLMRPGEQTKFSWVLTAATISSVNPIKNANLDIAVQEKTAILRKDQFVLSTLVTIQENLIQQ